MWSHLGAALEGGGGDGGDGGDDGDDGDGDDEDNDNWMRRTIALA